MADFDFLETLGISEDQLDQPQNAYERFMVELSKQITKELKEYIQKNAFNKGGLFQSVIPVPTGAMSFEIQADQYFKFIDEGVNPIGKKTFQTPYAFRSPFVSANHAAALKEWKGYDTKRAYASAYVTKHKYGIKPRSILNNVLTEDVLTRIGNDLEQLTGLMFDVKFNKATQQWQ